MSLVWRAAPRAPRRNHDPGAAWRRYKEGSGPLHELTETIAREIHETDHPGHSWNHDREHDTYLAVGAWIAAERVVRVLPLAVLS